MGKSKVLKFLIKDIKDFNKYILFFCCVVFLLCVGVISYKTNNSYALFSDSVTGTKTIELEVATAVNLDTSGANEPVLDDSMIPVYYDNTNEVWKKADESNSNETHKWYDYDNKMWANSVTVASDSKVTTEIEHNISYSQTLSYLYDLLEIDGSYVLTFEEPETDGNAFYYNNEVSIVLQDEYNESAVLSSEFFGTIDSSYEYIYIIDPSGYGDGANEYFTIEVLNFEITKTAYGSYGSRETYLNAAPGTPIPMDSILTMQVWIPRYKYKVWNYNANGTATSEPQQIEITWEDGTSKTGEITCQDAISGTNGSASETCKLKSTNATCTDSTCNNKTYTHPAFTFGDDELTGFWMGKFEISAPQDDACYTTANETNCNKTGITPLVKPDVMSYRYAQVGTFETNIMNMKNSGNQYGLKTTTDTHMAKNSEWGAVAYLSHSKYGTCTDGTCREVYINNSNDGYTGRSWGEAPIGGGGHEPESYNNLDDVVVLPLASSDRYGAYGLYTYDGYLLNENTKTTTKDISKVASTTGNIYGVYDMSGGMAEYTMSNMVSSDGSTMMSGYDSSHNSGYTGIIYDSGNYTSYTGTYTYPANKYIDKYSYTSAQTSRETSKLGDGIKEVYTGSDGWYYDVSEVLYSTSPLLLRGSYYVGGAGAGVFASSHDNYVTFHCSARLVLVGLE